MGEGVDAAFQYGEVHSIGADEHHQESNDFGFLVVMAFEIPNAVAEVTITTSGHEAEEIGQFQIPVQQLMKYPDHQKGD